MEARKGNTPKSECNAMGWDGMGWESTLITADTLFLSSSGPCLSSLSVKLCCPRLLHVRAGRPGCLARPVAPRPRPLPSRGPRGTHARKPPARSRGPRGLLACWRLVCVASRDARVGGLVGVLGAGTLEPGGRRGWLAGRCRCHHTHDQAVLLCSLHRVRVAPPTAVHERAVKRQRSTSS